MDRYEARIRLHGTTARERTLDRLRNKYSRRASSPSYRDVLVNGRDSALVIESGGKPFMKRFASLPGERIIAGDTVAWADRVWLVFQADSDHEFCTTGLLLECNDILYWQNDSGEIVCRPAFVAGVSFQVGEEEKNAPLMLASHQFLVHMPLDEETLSLPDGKRIVIDNHGREPGVYELTRPDRISLRFGEKGITNYLFTRTPYNRAADQRVTLSTGEQIWLADYKEFPDLAAASWDEYAACSILGDSILKVGYPKTYQARFTNSSGESFPYKDFYFNVDSSHPELVTTRVDGQELQVEITDRAMIGQTITVQVIYNGNHGSRAGKSRGSQILAEKAVKIQALF